MAALSQIQAVAALNTANLVVLTNFANQRATLTFLEADPTYEANVDLAAQLAAAATTALAGNTVTNP